MGLAERIVQAQAEAKAREQAAKLEAQRKLQEEKDMELHVKAMAAQRKEARKASLIVELHPFLEAVGARDQLEEIRKVWGFGNVDSQPELLETTTYSCLALSLRHQFG